jgi:drug/metabolite transporter (DMT)-like permease
VTPTTKTTPRRDRRVLILLALAAVYFVWGSTYLGIRFGLEGFPPLAMNAIRFIAAGGILYIWLRRRGAAAPTARQWRNAAAVGAILLIGGVGLVTIAEDLGVGSGLVATAVAVMPLWAALWAGLFGHWPVRLEWLGLGLGFGGVVLLAQEGDFQSTAMGTFLVIIAPVFWAFGSVWSGKLDLPDNSMATAAEMLSGGVMFAILSPVFGETFDGMPSAKAWLALAYLTLLGSLIAYSAYMYLLRTVRPTLATSYAYANPIVAVVLGITIGDETITGPAWIALPVILIGLAVVGYAQRPRVHQAPAAGTAVETLLPRR